MNTIILSYHFIECKYFEYKKISPIKIGDICGMYDYYYLSHCGFEMPVACRISETMEDKEF